MLQNQITFWKDLVKEVQQTFFFKILTVLAVGWSLSIRLGAGRETVFLTLIASAITFIPNLAIELIGFGTLAHLFVFNSAATMQMLNGRPSLYDFSNSQLEVPIESPIWMRILSVAIPFVTAWSILASKWPPVRRHPAVVATGVSVIMILMAHFFGGASLAGFAVIGVFFGWSRIFWPMLMLRRMGRASNGFQFQSLWMLRPMWSPDLIPQWEIQTTFSPEAMRENANLFRGKALLFCSLFALARLAAERINIWRISLGLPNLRIDGSILFVKTVPNVPTAWALILYDEAITIIFYLGFGTAIMITFQWLLGIPSRTNFQFPHRSKSYHEFMSRIMYYYSQTIQVTMLQPILPFVAKIHWLRENPRLRVFSLTFVSVAFVCFVYHYFRDIHLFFYLGLFESLLIYGKMFSIYVFLLSFFTALSAAYSKEISRELPFFKHSLRLLLIYFIYCMIHLPAVSYELENWNSKMELFRFLLTGSR